MKRLIIILSLAACNFVASIIALFMLFSSSMSRFDTGGSPSSSDVIFALITAVLHFPLVLLTEALSPIHFSSSPAEYSPFILNSLLWGAGIYYFGVWIRSRIIERAV